MLSTGKMYKAELSCFDTTTTYPKYKPAFSLLIEVEQSKTTTPLNVPSSKTMSKLSKLFCYLNQVEYIPFIVYDNTIAIDILTMLF